LFAKKYVKLCLPTIPIYQIVVVVAATITIRVYPEKNDSAYILDGIAQTKFEVTNKAKRTINKKYYE